MRDITLCVNIDHIATLRQNRGGLEPDPLQGAVIAEESGADGITVHLREDRRHIQDSDVRALRDIITGTYNLEMAMSDEIISIAMEISPDQITLVPEKREELTTEGGLDVRGSFKRISEVVSAFHDINVIVSLFVEPDVDVMKLSKETGADFVELHTGTYCNVFGKEDINRELDRLYAAAECAVDIDLGVNAGHGLNYENVELILGIPGLRELNIGHSIISRSVFTGLSRAVKEMIAIIRQSPLVE